MNHILFYHHIHIVINLLHYRHYRPTMYRFTNHHHPHYHVNRSSRETDYPSLAIPHHYPLIHCDANAQIHSCSCEIPCSTPPTHSCSVCVTPNDSCAILHSPQSHCDSSDSPLIHCGSFASSTPNDFYAIPYSPPNHCDCPNQTEIPTWTWTQNHCAIHCETHCATWTCSYDFSPIPNHRHPHCPTQSSSFHHLLQAHHCPIHCHCDACSCHSPTRWWKSWPWT